MGPPLSEPLLNEITGSVVLARARVRHRQHRDVQGNEGAFCFPANDEIPVYGLWNRKRTRIYADIYSYKLFALIHVSHWSAVATIIYKKRSQKYLSCRVALGLSPARTAERREYRAFLRSLQVYSRGRKCARFNPSSRRCHGDRQRTLSVSHDAAGVRRRMSAGHAGVCTPPRRGRRAPPPDRDRERIIFPRARPERSGPSAEALFEKDPGGSAAFVAERRRLRSVTATIPG